MIDKIPRAFCERWAGGLDSAASAEYLDTFVKRVTVVLSPRSVGTIREGILGPLTDDVFEPEISQSATRVAVRETNDSGVVVHEVTEDLRGFQSESVVTKSSLFSILVDSNYTGFSVVDEYNDLRLGASGGRAVQLNTIFASTGVRIKGLSLTFI